MHEGAIKNLGLDSFVEFRRELVIRISLHTELLDAVREEIDSWQVRRDSRGM